MCVTLVGGMDRLKAEYTAAARECGWDLRLLGHNDRNFSNRIGDPDLLIVFTNKVSHEARHKAANHAKSRNIPLYYIHSCGVSSLRESIREHMKKSLMTI